MILIAKALEAWVRRAVAAAGFPAGVIDEEQVLWIVHRKRLHQHGVDQTEDRRIGADAEGERQKGNSRERRRSSQEPECVDDIAAQFVEEAQANRLAALVLTRSQAAELGTRTPVSFLGRQTASAQIRFVQLHVRPHLVFHVTLERDTPAGDSEPGLHAHEHAHTSSAASSFGRREQAPECFALPSRSIAALLLDSQGEWSC